MKTLTHAAKRLSTAFTQLYQAVTAESAPSRLELSQLYTSTLKDVDPVILDAERVLRAADTPMSFKEFLHSPFATEQPWCRLTVECGEAQVGVVLQWRPENYKWMAPSPVEGFVECGYLTDIGPIRAYGELKGHITDVQILVPNVILGAWQPKPEKPTERQDNG